MSTDPIAGPGTLDYATHGQGIKPAQPALGVQTQTDQSTDVNFTIVPCTTNTLKDSQNMLLAKINEM